jgi:hypothetical protein
LPAPSCTTVSLHCKVRIDNLLRSNSRVKGIQVPILNVVEEQLTRGQLEVVGSEVDDRDPIEPDALLHIHSPMIGSIVQHDHGMLSQSLILMV